MGQHPNLHEMAEFENHDVKRDHNDTMVGRASSSNTDDTTATSALMDPRRLDMNAGSPDDMFDDIDPSCYHDPLTVGDTVGHHATSTAGTVSSVWEAQQGMRSYASSTPMPPGDASMGYTPSAEAVHDDIDRTLHLSDTSPLGQRHHVQPQQQHAHASDGQPDLLGDLTPDQFHRVQQYMQQKLRQQSLTDGLQRMTMTDQTSGARRGRTHSSERGDRARSRGRDPATTGGIQSSAGTIGKRAKSKTRSKSRQGRAASLSRQDHSQDRSRSNSSVGHPGSDNMQATDQQRLDDSLQYLPPIQSPVEGSPSKRKEPWVKYDEWNVNLHKASVRDQLKAARHTATYPLVTEPRDDDILRNANNTRIEPPSNIRQFCEHWLEATATRMDDGRMKRERVNWNVVIKNTKITCTEKPPHANADYYGRTPILYCAKRGDEGCQVKIVETNYAVPENDDLVRFTYTYYQKQA